MKLVDTNTREPLHVGDTVTTFRGQVGTLVTVKEPRSDGSTGRVYVRFEGQQHAREFFPSVIGASWSE